MATLHIPFRAGLFLLALLCAGSPALAQQTGIWEIIDTAKLEYYGHYQEVLDIADAQDYVIIGNDQSFPQKRLVRRTTDGGTTWRHMLEDTTGNHRWTSVVHPSPDLIVVIGDTTTYLTFGDFGTEYRYQGFFMVSQDGGKTWTRHDRDSNTVMDRIAMCNAQHGVIAQRCVTNAFNQTAPPSDTLLRTTDGWKSWTEVPLPAYIKYIRDLACPEPDVYIARIYDYQQKVYYLYRTTDGGSTWARSDSLPDGFIDMMFLDRNLGWATGGIRTGLGDGERDVIYKTTDGGMTWTTQVDEQIGNYPLGLRAIAFADPDNGIAVGRANKILRSRDGGKTWTREYPPGVINVSTFPMRFLRYPAVDAAVAVFNMGPAIKYSGKQTLLPPIFTRPMTAAPQPINGVEIAWEPIIGATRYQLQLAPDTLANNMYDPTVFERLSLDTVITTTSLVVKGLKYHHRYYAQVRAINDQQQSDWHRAEALFYTISGPDKLFPPKIIAPTAGSQNQPLSLLVEWEPVSGAQLYDIQVADNGIYVAPVVDDSLLSGTTYQVDNLAPNMLYFVRVRARGGTTFSDWSSTSAPHVFETGAVSSVTPGPVPGIEQLSVVPNPAADRITVSLSSFGYREVDLHLFDQLGRRITTAVVTEGDNAIIDLKDMPNGVYLIQASRNGTPVAGRHFVVRR